MATLSGMGAPYSRSGLPLGFVASHVFIFCSGITSPREFRRGKSCEYYYSAFPARLRRSRTILSVAVWSLENQLTVDDLILPVFIIEGPKLCDRKLPSMPGVFLSCRLICCFMMPRICSGRYTCYCTISVYRKFC